MISHNLRISYLVFFLVFATKNSFCLVSTYWLNKIQVLKVNSDVWIVVSKYDENVFYSFKKYGRSKFLFFRKDVYVPKEKKIISKFVNTNKKKYFVDKVDHISLEKLSTNEKKLQYYDDCFLSIINEDKNKICFKLFHHLSVKPSQLIVDGKPCFSRRFSKFREWAVFCKYSFILNNIL